jgi:hypothetical protein
MSNLNERHYKKAFSADSLPRFFGEAIFIAGSLEERLLRRSSSQ